MTWASRAGEGLEQPQESWLEIISIRQLAKRARSLPIFELAPIPAFRNWWVSDSIGRASVNLAPLALAWTAFQSTDSAFWIGIVNGFPVFVIVPFTLIGGVLLDRTGRLRLFRQVHLGLAVVFAGLGIALSLNTATSNPVVLVPVAAVTAAASSILVLAGRLLALEIVAKDLLPNALSLSYVLRSVLVLVGPVLMGVAIAYASVGLFFGLLGLVHAVAWFAASRISIAVHPVERDEKSMFADIVAGLRYCRNSPAVAWLLAIGLAATFGNIYLVFLAPYAKDVLKIGPGGYGLLIAAESAGGISGALALGALSRIRRKGVALVASSVIFGLAVIVFAYSTNTLLAVSALFIMGASSAIWIAMINTCIQLAAEPSMRGRVTAVYSTIARSVRPLGYLLGGTFALIAESSTVIIVGAIILMGINLTALTLSRSVRIIE